MDEIKVLPPSFLRHPEGVLPGENPPPFRLGETLSGRVIQQVDPGHAFLQLGGQNLLVENHVPLPTGIDLRFQVEEVQPKLILKFLPLEGTGEGKVYSLLKKVLSEDIPLAPLAEKWSALARLTSPGISPPAQESWKQFLSLLWSFTPSGFFSADPGALPRLLAQSGLFWENKLKNWVLGGGKDSPGRLTQGDMKGLGKRLLDQLIADSSSPTALSSQQAEDLKQGLEALLRKIELYQLMNLNQSGGSEPFYLFLPFWMGNHLQFIELNLSFPREKTGAAEREGTSVLFLLNLPALGKVRVEVQIQGKDLFCRFMVSDPRVSEFVHRALPELKGRLQQMGYHPHLQSSVETMAILEEAPARDLKRESQNLLSVII